MLIITCLHALFVYQYCSTLNDSHSACKQDVGEELSAYMLVFFLYIYYDLAI